MAWTAVHQQIRDHRKTRDFFRILGVSRQEAIGILVLIWTWALDNCDRDGRLIATTVEDIASAAYWTGDAKKLFDALVEARWIDSNTGGTYLHDWYDFNKPFYDYIDRREKDKIRKSNGKPLANPPKFHGNSTEIPQEFRESHSPSHSLYISYFIYNSETRMHTPVDNVEKWPDASDPNVLIVDNKGYDITGMTPDEVNELRMKLLRQKMGIPEEGVRF